MKKIIKYTVVGILFLLSIFGITKVNAETYTGQAIWPSEWISDIYIKKVKPNGYTKYQQARFIRRSEDNQFVYCIQPYTDIDNNLPYYEVIRSDWEVAANMTKEQWNRISLVAYYGYGYSGHTDKKWYPITQVMIWRLSNPESDIFFTDKLNGSKITSYDDEIAEINALVDSHYTKPSFNASDLTVPLGQSITLTDSNNILNKFKVTSTENVTATIDGNNLIITANGIGTGKVNLGRKDSKYTMPPVLYVSDHSQNVFRVGSYDPIYDNLSLKVIGGRIEINKLDSDCNCKTPSGQATLKGAKYGIYDTSGNLIETLTTDDNAYAISNYLPSLGEFIVKEISPSSGYTLDKNTYSVMIDENSLLVNVDVYEKVVTGSIDITKVMASAKTGLMTPESNVKFGIYDNSNKLVKEVTTDKDGKFETILPYGSYTLKQLTTTKGFEYASDYNFKIDSDGKQIKEVISNAEITAKLKVIKIDSETKEVIKRANIKFKIYDVNNNNYVCQTITYPKASTICEYETDSEGILITPYPLFSGDYKLEEVDQAIDGYLWNKESVQFSIDENTKLITDNEYGILFETKFENTRVKGSIEIKKYGEEPKLSDNKVTYENKPLKGITYGLYQDGKLLNKYVTDENGIIKIENLELGKYTIKELETLENYILDEKEYEINLKYKDQYTAIINDSIKLNNEHKKGNLEFTKTDLVTGDVIPNVLISIYTDKDELVFEGRTDENGKVIITELPYGHKYYIKETEPATGYLLSDEIINFEITEDGKIIKAEMTNKPITGTLEFTKTDFSTSETLPNTKIQIFNEKDELVYEGITNEEGKIIIDELRYGKYYILESEAPEGYEINPNKMYFEITEDGEIVKCTMQDELIVEVPNTNLEDKTSTYISIGLVIVGLGLIIYGIKKKNK